MILIGGEILPSSMQNEILVHMEKKLCMTLIKPPLDPMCVIEACDKLSRRIEEGIYNDLIKEIGLDERLLTKQVNLVIQLLRRESLLAMLECQVDNQMAKENSYTPPFTDKVIKKKRMPLGVLFHIAAGNVDGLPVFSVVEGLLAGNINILKLPQVDKGFSIQLLSELIAVEPKLKDYIYVFDTPSTDIHAMQQMANLSDGVVVWGGDLAVKAARNMVQPGTKLIEWGHKLSFAYITLDGITEESLGGLAEHLFMTRQLLCSSCQTIYIDTTNQEDLYAFCEQFLPFMKEAFNKYPINEVGLSAESTLKIYHAELEALFSDMKVFKGEGYSLIAKTDSELELSFMFGNCLVKRLPRSKIVEVLRRSKGYLQTAGLICTPKERKELTNQLLRAGVVRVKSPREMSMPTCIDAHDGEYPLQRYSRIVEWE